MPQFETPLFDDVPPTYYQGRTAISRQASASGAVAARADRASKVDRVRRLWRKPYTMQQVQQITGIPLTSICSIKACLDRELIAVGSDDKYWADGRVTCRTVWQLSAYHHATHVQDPDEA
jgi:hypothetical protein